MAIGWSSWRRGAPYECMPHGVAITVGEPMSVWDERKLKAGLAAVMNATPFSPSEIWLTPRQWSRYKMLDFRDRGGMGT